RISTLQTQGGEVFEDKLYLAKANPRQPEVGDLRIGYAAYAPGGTVTVYGELETMGSLTPHRRDGVGMYRLFAGTQEDALAQLTREHGPQLWSCRALMGLLSWAGLWLMLARLNGWLSQLPFPGGHGRVISGAQTLPIALVMTGALVLAIRATHHLGMAVAVEALALLLACHFWGELPARAKRKLI
ncbi:MAG: TMEM43 family protein, partial [Candidatus Sericytochromatia bacterium]|nr:TMEM43 family protein [Candidatus Sericytochromatia bacterium]